MPECIFCKYARNQAACARVFENDYAFAFLDSNPASKGHTLVIPKKHFGNIGKMPDRELRELGPVLRDVAKAVAKAAMADGFNIVQSNGTAAGQSVMHVHFHVLPRFEGDRNSMEWRRSKYESPEDAQKWANAIKRHLK